jgi:hypothetical protein
LAGYRDRCARNSVRGSPQVPYVLRAGGRARPRLYATTCGDLPDGHSPQQNGAVVTVYTPRGALGHSIGWQNVDRGRLVGWLSPHPKPGDEFHSPMASGKTGVYEITKVDPCWDPPDMFFADVKWRGYAEDLSAAAATASAPQERKP